MVISFIPFLNSCEEEGLDVKQPEAYDATWADYAKLKFEPAIDDLYAFEYYVEAGANGNEYWNTTEVSFNVAVNLGDNPISDISKIEIYAFAEEKNGDSFKYIGGKQGKLYETVTNPSESFVLTISKDKLEELFKTDFSANHNGEVLTNDLFEFKWVITGKDDSVVDTRTDCFDFDCTYGIQTKVIDVAPAIWEGTFNYEWIAATDNAKLYGKISIGKTGTMTFTLQPGFFTVYDVSHLSADYYYGSSGTLNYDYESGLVEISGKNAQHWDIVDITGPTLTIDFSYYYSVGYDEYGTFTLTRTDGKDWPTNLHTN